jgi:hypothetical protein
VLQILSAIVAQNQALGVGRGLVARHRCSTRAAAGAARALHDAAVIIISDFDGADDETREMVGAMARTTTSWRCWSTIPCRAICRPRPA